MKYIIDADKLIAEIERQQRRLTVLSLKGSVDMRRDCALQNGVYDSILDSIKSLRQELTEADLEKEIKFFLTNAIKMNKGQWRGEYHIGEIGIRAIAHRFYELGKNSK